MPSTHDPHAIPLEASALLVRHAGRRFAESVLELHDLYHGELTDEIVLQDFADYLTDLVASRRGVEGELDQACDGLEATVAALTSLAERAGPSGEEDGRNGLALVADHLLAALSPGTIARIEPCLGPATLSLLESVTEEG